MIGNPTIQGGSNDPEAVDILLRTAGTNDVRATCASLRISLTT